jgi:hypothetical protein
MYYLKILSLAIFLLTSNATYANLIETIASDTTRADASQNLVRSHTVEFDITKDYEDITLFFDTEDGYNASFKHIELLLDGNQILDWGGSTYVNPAPNIEALGSSAYRLYGTVNIEQTLWDSILIDNKLSVTWNQYSVGDPFQANNNVTFIISGIPQSVSSPSLYGLFLVCLISILFLKKKRSV